jgi:hypothetical protein
MAAFAALIFVVLLGVAHPAFGQEAAQESVQEPQVPAGVFGPSDAGLDDRDSDSRLHLRPDLQLIEILAPAERSAARASVRGVSPVTLGPFGRAYPFARLRVYLGRKAPTEPKERGFVDEATPVLLVSADDRRGRTRWWQLAAKETQDARDIFTISDEPDAEERIGPAADPAIPLILVRYGYESRHVSHTVQLLLDFRAAQSNLIAAYEAWLRDGGGCRTYGVKTGTNCAWNAQRGDFLCTERLVRTDTMWSSGRRMTRQFWLASAVAAAKAAADDSAGTDAAGGVGDAVGDAVDDDPAIAAAIIQRLTDAPDGSVTAEVPRLGATHHLANGVLADGARYRLFAAPGIASVLDARIVAVIARPGEVPRLVTVRQAAQIDGATSSFTPLDVPADLVAEHEARFAAIRVDGGDTRGDAGGNASATPIYKIIVGEEAGSSMYLVAIGAGATTQHPPRLDALLLSTDAQSYDTCGYSAIPETAVRADIVAAAPFTMDIEVEPKRRENYNDVDESDPENETILTFEDTESCGWRGTIRWSPTGGFDVKKIADACDARARIAAIGDDGSLSASTVYQRVVTSDVRARFIVFGRGEPTVLLLSDPDFSERRWEPVAEQLARTRSTVVFTPSRLQQDGDALKPLVSQVQAIVEAVQAKRVFVVAHGRSAGYAVAWAAAHPELVAGTLILRPSDAMIEKPAEFSAFLEALIKEALITNVLP